MICPNCGAQNREGARFCRTCGFTFNAAPAQKVPEPTIAAEETDDLITVPLTGTAAAAQPAAQAALPTEPLAALGSSDTTEPLPEIDPEPTTAELPEAPAAATNGAMSFERDDLDLAGGYAADDSVFGQSEPHEAAANGLADDDGAAIAQAEAAMTAGTGGGRVTRKLDEDETAEMSETAPLAPGDPFPPLAKGDLVADRYRILDVLQTGPQRQTYLAADEKGYTRCWACGSTNNEPGEVYCNDCGAQLSGRVYRLYETPASSTLAQLPAKLLAEGVAAVAQVIDASTDAKTGRHYLVVEESDGRPLAQVIEEGDAKAAARPSQERLLNWMTQATGMLDELHKAGIVGCDFTPDSLHVLSDERIVMSDPISCRAVGADKNDELQADTQRVSAALEQLYASLSGLPLDKTPATPAPTGKPEDMAGILRAGREGKFASATELSGALRDIFDVMVPPRDMQLVSGRSTDVGVQRELNEDSLLVLEFLAMEAAGSMPVGIYVVADGMGGHQSGEVASSIAIRTVGSILQSKVLAGQVTGEDNLPDPERTAEVVRQAVLEANRRIVELGRQRKSDMGTTITLALVIGNQVTVANVGDSRTYMWRDGKLEQISRDHSLVARLVAAGQLTVEESRYFERRNEIYLALGDPHLSADQIDVFNRTLRPFDALLLCSDGLWEMVPDPQIVTTLRAGGGLGPEAQALVNLANRNGGEDNISVIIAQAVIAEKEKPEAANG